jgi:hypothetical protein
MNDSQSLYKDASSNYQYTGGNMGGGATYSYDRMN